MQLSPTQWDFLTDTHRFTSFVSGRGCGKSTIATLKLLEMCQSPGYTGARGIVWGPTYPQLKHGTLVTFDDWFYRADMIVEKKDGNEPERRLRNDILIVFRNASNPDQTRGHEYAFAWLDEAGQMDEQVFRLTNAATRQRRRDGTFYPRKMLLTTTPRGKNWIYRYFKDESHPKFLGDQSAHYETNTYEAMKYGIAAPTYVDEMGYVEGTLEHAQEVLGQYVSWGGLAFYAFDERKHYDRTYAPPPFDSVRGGIDIGFSAPTAITVTGRTSAGKFITFKEFYQRNCPPHVWMPQVKQLQDDHNVGYFDVDAAFPREIATLRNLGVRARPSQKSQDARGASVSYINGLFSRGDLVLMAVPNLKREVESWELKEHLSGDEVTFLDKVKPNQDDHAIDSWCYHIPNLSASGAPRKRQHHTFAWSAA